MQAHRLEAMATVCTPYGSRWRCGRVSGESGEGVSPVQIEDYTVFYGRISSLIPHGILVKTKRYPKFGC